MSLARDQFIFEVVANVPLCREHFKLVLRTRQFPSTSPGQFVQIACNPVHHDIDVLESEIEWDCHAQPRLQGEELTTRSALLRRPFSLAGRRDTSDGVEIDIIHRVVGIGTQWLANLKPGDHVSVIGPLGNRFSLPPEDGVAILVGGGVGIPPMIYLGSHLTGRRAVVFSGAQTRDLLPLQITNAAPPPDAVTAAPLYNIEPFAAFGIPAVISTDDGSYGYRGFITQALEQYLDRFFTTPDVRSRAVIYTCGPEPMMKRVAEIADTRSIACQVAVERAMACGMGTCQSCCIRVKKPDPAAVPMPGQDWCYRLACTDGPVFKSTELLW